MRGDARAASAARADATSGGGTCGCRDARLPTFPTPPMSKKMLLEVAGDELEVSGGVARTSGQKQSTGMYGP
ncbi:hypothetical protein ABZP36_021758 [Zizania latifolia]